MSYHYPPGPSTRLPWVHVRQFRRDRLDYLSRLQRDYGDAVSLTLGGRSIVLFTQPRIIRKLLVDHAGNFTIREAFGGARSLFDDQLGMRPRLLRRSFGRFCCGCNRQDGLLTIDGQDHHDQRRLAQPLFTKQRLAGYADEMAAQTLRTIDGWQAGTSVDLVEELHGLALRTVARVLFGLDLARGSDVERAFNRVVNFSTRPRSGLRGLAPSRTAADGMGYEDAWKVLERTAEELIAARRRDPAGSTDVVSALLAARLPDGTPLTDHQIRQHALVLLGTGHTTIWSALSWTLCLVSQHPEVSAHIRAELDDVLGGRAPSTGDLARLQYVEMVVKESLRLYPPIWATVRRAQDDFEVEGYRLPGDSLVLFSQWVTHRLPELYPDPMRFLPERFAADQNEPPPPFAYFPFGTGIRSCIGGGYAMVQLKVSVATILQRFAPRLVPGHPVEPHARDAVVLPRYGLPMILGAAREPSPVPRRGHVASDTGVSATRRE